LESKRTVGTVAIYNIDHTDQSAEYGRLIIEEQSRLFSVEIAYLALAFAFEQLGMKTLYGHVKDTNLAALKFDQAVGFVIERHLDDEVFKGQHYQNFTRVTMDTAGFAQLKQRWAKRVLAG
jgi:RimJ/RimL family protein N-acetyltransferase